MSNTLPEPRLYLFIDKVDAELFKSVELKNLEASNIQHSNEIDLLHRGINQSVVTHVHKVTEESSKDVLDDGRKTNSDSIQVLSLVDPFSSNLERELLSIIFLIGSGHNTLYLGLMKQS